MNLPQSFTELMDQANREALYKALIKQLNKDLSRAGVHQEFKITITPNDLKQELSVLLKQLMEQEFDKYLSLLYAIDVSESKIKSLEVNDTQALSEAVAFLILQREWQKVWMFRELS